MQVSCGANRVKITNGLQEASELSGLKPKLDAAGVHLYGIVHETKGVAQFQPYLKGEIYLDAEVINYYY